MTSEKTRARIARTLAGAVARGPVDPDALYDNRSVETRVRGGEVEPHARELTAEEAARLMLDARRNQAEGDTP